MIGLGLDLCQEQLSTPIPAVPVLWIRKRSAMLAVCSLPESQWRRFRPPMDPLTA